MPAFQLCSQKYLIASDDLVLFVPWLIPLHALWAYLDYSKVVDEALEVIDCPLEYRYADALLCVATIPLDSMISVISAWGPIMKPRKCGRTLQVLVVLRCLFIFPIIVTFCFILQKAIVHTMKRAGHFGEEFADVAGWGPVLQERWAVILILLVIFSRLLIYLAALVVMALLVVPKGVRDRVFSVGTRAALFLVGVRDDMVNGIMSIIMNDLGGNLTLEDITPTDWIFGVLLAAAAQRQGFLGFDPDMPDKEVDEENLPILTRPKRRGKRLVHPTVQRASMLAGQQRPVTPLDPEKAEDHAVVGELVRLMPYASGIYGQQFGMSLIKDSVEPGTHLPSCCRALSACCLSCPCVQPQVCSSAWECLRRFGCCCCCYTCCAPAGFSDHDYSTALNEDALRRALKAGSQRAGTVEPELVWVSWLNTGLATSPPLAVLVDHQRQEVIITVRGTADMKDCIADAGARPLFFDPFGWAKKDQPRSMPFDTEEDLFVHGTMLLCAEDALHRMRHKRLLEDLLGANPYGEGIQGKARGYGVVCVGHSLGAGVACLLALLLKATLQEAREVRYVGFEPPGGLLCKRLSIETQRLGWFAVACSHDWVPRIGIRNLQRLKVMALEELESCDRSKLQLTFLAISGMIKQLRCFCCFRRPLAGIFRCLGGGSLTREDEDGVPLVRNASTSSRFKDEVRFPELWPPGDIVYLRPVEHVFRCCFLVEQDTEWTAQWADPEDLDELLITARAIDLHVPWVYEDAIENVARAFEEEVVNNRAAATAREKCSEVLSRSRRQEK